MITEGLPDLDLDIKNGVVQSMPCISPRYQAKPRAIQFSKNEPEFTIYERLLQNLQVSRRESEI